MRPTRRVWAIVAAVLSANAATAQDIDLRHSTVATGGGVVEAGPFRLLVTIGEPAVSRVASGPYALTSGLQAVFLEGAGLNPDAVFQDSFETTPIAAPQPTSTSGEMP